MAAGFQKVAIILKAHQSGSLNRVFFFRSMRKFLLI